MTPESFEVFDAVGHLALLLTPSARIVRMNRALERLTGYSTEEAKGRDLADLFLSAQDAGVVRGALGRLAAGESVAEGANWWRFRNGSRAYLRWRTGVVANSDGSVRYIVATGTETTPETGTAESLSRAEQRYATLFQSSDAFAWTLDTDGRLAHISENAAHYTYDAAPDELVGRGFYDLQPETAERDLAALRQAFEGQSIAGIEMTHRRRSGQLVHFIVNAVPVRDGLGNVVAITGTGIDITARKRVEEALRRSEQRYRSLVEQASEGITLCDLEGHYSQVNQSFCELLGYRADELLAMRVQDLVDKETPDPQPLRFKEVADGATVRSERRLRRKDGSIVIVSVSARVVEGGEILAVISDVTALKEAQAERQRYAEELEQQVAKRTEALRAANEDLESFAYSVSHDLRTPLRAIRGFVDLLVTESGSQLDADGKLYASRIADATDRLDELISDLLTYSRVVRAERKPERVALGDVIAEVLEGLDETIRAKRAHVRVRHPLPSVLGDGSALYQVFLNLLSNALKFSKPGQAPEVDVSAVSSGSDVSVVVRDRGVGIPPAYRERVFHLFERLHDQSTYPGTGLGLPIARRAVKRLGGTIELDSTEGQGTTVTVNLRAPQA